MLSRRSKRNWAKTFILIGDGFDELEVVYFLHKFREAGLPIKTVSLFDRLVTSRQGVGLKADYALADMPFDPELDCLIVLPAGGHNGEILRHDARVKSLLRSLNRAGQGRIAVTRGNSRLWEEIGEVVTERPRYRPEQDEDLPAFVESLRDRVVYAV